MKKIYFSIIGLMTITGLSAQITLTSATSTPNTGDLNSITTGNGALNVSHDGANEVWDFSAASGTVGVAEYKTLANSTDFASFPNANLVEVFTNQGENYYNNSSTSLTLEGHYIDGLARIVYNDKREYLMFPLTYNTVYNETFDGVLEVFSNGALINRGGTIVMSGDGYGDLILPYTTAHNVLRVKSIVDYSDVYNGVTIANYIDTIYSWYNAVNNTFIATYSVSSTDGTNTGHFWTYLNQSDYVTSIDEEIAEIIQPLEIFPNPASNMITLTNVNGIETVNILNLKGQVIKTINGISENQRVYLDDFPHGVYFIQYTTNETVFTEKLIVN